MLVSFGGGCWNLWPHSRLALWPQCARLHMGVMEGRLSEVLTPELERVTLGSLAWWEWASPVEKLPWGCDISHLIPAMQGLRLMSQALLLALR